MIGNIEVRGLTRTFHTTVRRPGFAGALRSLVNPERVAKHAVSDITFDVAAGELLALLGPNGAGKSTTIKMLTGILTPTSGEARVAGVVPYRERERNARNIGAVFGQRTQLWWDLPVRESFAILRDIYEVPKAEHAARLREFDELLDLLVPAPAAAAPLLHAARPGRAAVRPDVGAGRIRCLPGGRSGGTPQVTSSSRGVRPGPPTRPVGHALRHAAHRPAVRSAPLHHRVNSNRALAAPRRGDGGVSAVGPVSRRVHGVRRCGRWRYPGRAASS